MKSGARFKWNRRHFLKASLLLGLGTTFLQACKRKANHILLKLTGTNHILGHRLWLPDFPPVSEKIEIPVLILGGGIAGLSAAYQFHEKGFQDFLLLEMEDEVGGNSKSGSNPYSKHPLGAHYLPIPNASNKEIYQFLEKSKIVKGWTEAGEPIFDEEQLSFDPMHRLFIENYWQDGIVPEYGLDEEELAEMERFHSLMKDFTVMKGRDGKYVFDIPTLFASTDHDLEHLDSISMEKWLLDQGFKSKPLIGYVNYCCRDDFGTGVKHTSAFAGIHYFSSRKHDYLGNEEAVLTWQEGNGRLVSLLKKYAEGKIRNNCLAYKVDWDDHKVQVKVYDSKSNKSTLYIANQVINCCPQFVNKYLIPSRKALSDKFAYAPWLVATITLKSFPAASGAPLSWDNVIHGGKGLGYIFDQHQSLAQYKAPYVISYYHSLDAQDLRKERKKLLEYNEEQWRDFIIEDLSKAHFGIEAEILDMKIYRLGHGMISPVPGFLMSDARKEMARPIAERIYFAHSDLSGLSLFEEAFYRGYLTAKEVLTKYY